MARDYCQKCERPVSNCICRFMVATENQHQVVLLQHPKEVNHPKGTANLLRHSLAHCLCFIGENFDQHVEFLTFLSQCENPVLLYPENNSETLGQLNVSLEKCTLLVIDSTWKKSYKIFQLSKCLQNLAKVQLPAGIKGQYDIRSTSKVNALSTLEATCHALALIEQDQQKYQPLIKSFALFNQYQLSFRKF